MSDDMQIRIAELNRDLANADVEMAKLRGEITRLRAECQTLAATLGLEGYAPGARNSVIAAYQKVIDDQRADVERLRTAIKTALYKDAKGAAGILAEALATTEPKS